MQKEKDEFERTQTEATTQIQSQLDAAMKQIRNLIKKSEDMDEELKESKKTSEGKVIWIHSRFLSFMLSPFFYQLLKRRPRKEAKNLRNRHWSFKR